MPFKSEHQLSTTFLEKVDELLSSLQEVGLYTKPEVRAPGGIPDYVIYRYSDESVHYLIAIEFKLKNWRRALKQAFRYENFANEVYVILDREQASKAIENVALFEAANVGLIVFDVDESIEIVHLPVPSIPFSEHFARTVANEIIPPERPLAEDLPFIRTVRGGLRLQSLRNL